MCRVCRRVEQNFTNSMLAAFSLEGEREDNPTHRDSLTRTCVFFKKIHMASNGIQKKQWGAIEKSKENVKAAAGAKQPNDAAPQLQRPAGGGGEAKAVLLMDVDTSKLKVSPELKKGTYGDHFYEISYDEKKLAIQWTEMPGYRRMPFDAGPAQNANPGEGSWSVMFEITTAEYDKILAIENAIFEQLMPRKEEILAVLKPPKPGKPPSKMTDEQFRELFNSQTRPFNVEKGWSAQMRAGLQTNPVGKDGKPRSNMPKLLKAKLKGENQWTDPKICAPEELVRGSAIHPVIEVTRGVYLGQAGIGVKHAVRNLYLFTNKNFNNRMLIDVSHMTVVPDSDDEEEEKKPKEQQQEQQFAEPAYENPNGAFDDGSGGMM